MRFARAVRTLFAFWLALGFASRAQVTTATLYGVVRDASGAVAPNASVTITNQGTGLSREVMSDASGEFSLVALPPGRYTLKISLTGFKTFTNEGLELGAGQVARQTFSLEVGQLTENVTVAETAPLVETASAAQKESLGTQEVRGLPLARRNITNLLTLSTGVTEAATGIAGGGNIRLNGVAEGGTAITVDGTDATANNETRGLNTYGAQNQISVMSIEALAEVQIVKGVLPAEHGAATGGQVNMITRSGTNAFHGSVFENYQNEKLFARPDPFLPLSVAKPYVRFNQYGFSLGGPIIKNRVFFFGTYEGYQARQGVSQQGTVPTQQLRDRILAALPMPETKIVLDAMPLPNSPINADVGMFRDAKPQSRGDNTFLIKGDVAALGGNISATVSRLRPTTVNPSIFIGPGNDQRFNNEQDRVAAQYVLARAGWVSESRFGWNRNQLLRTNDFWFVTDPALRGDTDLTEVGRRVPMFTLTGLFSTPTSEILALRGRSFSFDQKLSLIRSTHNLKMGFRWARQAGDKTNPQNPAYTFQTTADLLANIPNSLLLQSGIPAHDAHLDDFGFFFQDDWRVNQRLVLNLGARWDFYPVFKIHATSDRPAELVNLERPTDINKLDFGAPRPAGSPYNADWNNFGPRAGFAWTVDKKGDTVVRGGVGVLFSPQLFAMIQNNITDPFLPSTISYNRTDLASRGLKWATYGEDIQNAFRAGNGGRRAVSGLIDTQIRNPYTIQSMINVQRSFGAGWMAEAGYVRTDGKNFPLHRPLANAFDRQTGVRANPTIGSAGLYYVTSEQTMVYNALQTSLRKRFSNLGLGIHYTASRGWAEQGGALTSPFVNGDIFVTQDFFNPFFDRAPLSQEARHRIASDVLYQLPWLKSRRGWMSYVFGGWQVSGIISIRTGVPMRVTQPSGISQSRPDIVNGVEPVFENYRDTLLYLNRNAFQTVPTYPTTNATVRPGTANPALVRGPANWTVNTSFGKTFTVTETIRVELRCDAFNAFNHVNYNNPQLNITSPQFGVITGAAPMRTVQLAGRLTF